MFKQNLLQGKIALVTGGRSGIGYAISKQFLELGAKVYIASRKEELLVKAKEELSAYGPCEAFVCDIRKTDQIQGIVAGIQANEGRLDILVNNAGGQFPSLAENISENGWNAVINNNLNGTFFMTQAMAKAFFIKQKEGIVVNIIANIYRGFPGMVHTGAARAGVDNLTKSLAIEWAKYNIRVNAIAPGVIQSSGMDNYPPQLVEGISESIPMKRMGSVEDVSHLVTFLTSPMAGFITGETVYVDGGHRLSGDVFKFW